MLKLIVRVTLDKVTSTELLLKKDKCTAEQGCGSQCILLPLYNFSIGFTG
jgi:hypothetical protein